MDDDLPSYASLGEESFPKKSAMRKTPHQSPKHSDMVRDFDASLSSRGEGMKLRNSFARIAKGNVSPKKGGGHHHHHSVPTSSHHQQETRKEKGEGEQRLVEVLSPPIPVPDDEEENDISATEKSGGDGNNRLTANALNQNAYEVYQHHKKDMHHQSASEDGGDLSDASSNRSSVMTDDTNASEGVRALKSFTHVKIPFHIQVLLLMAVPMAFLVGVLLESVIVASERKVYVASHRDLVMQAITCTNTMMLERGEMSQFISFPPGSDLAIAQRALLDGILRAKVNTNCNRVRYLAEKSGESAIRNSYRNEVVEVQKDWERLRTLSDLRQMDGIVREEKARAVDRINDVISRIAEDNKASTTARSLLQLKFARYMANYIGAMRASGAFVISLKGNQTLAQDIAYNRLLVFYKANLAHFRREMNSVGNTWLHEVLDHPLTKTTLDYIARVSSGNYSLYANITQSQYFNQFTDMLRIMNTFATTKGGMLDDATAGKRETLQIVQSVLVMFFAFLCSILAATYLVYRQQQQVKQLEQTIRYSSDMNKAVRRYVPRRFLMLMGSTSVMQVTAGEKTEVAVTMLSSDIRDFTRISSQMTNERLFDWLQNYLSAMTQVTEDFSGFVDKFVGDAVFSVFQSCDKAVHCAVHMHLHADKLNLDLVTQNSFELVKIGVGIHHGVVSAGILGDDTRHTATLVASDINMASRLEGLTKAFGARILITKAVAERCALQQFAHRRIGFLKGVQETKPIELFEIFQPESLALKIFKSETKDKFNDIIDQWEDGKDVAKARETIEELLRLQSEKKVDPGDKALEFLHEHITDEGIIKIDH